MATLESAGYARSVFTTSDLFGQPMPFDFTQARTALPVGHDDSALPELSNPAYAQPNNHNGSSVDSFAPRTQRQVNSEQGSYATMIFIGVVVVALWYKQGGLQ